MKQYDGKLFGGTVDGSVSVTDTVTDSSYITSISMQATVTGTVQGTLKMQASNDDYSVIVANGGPVNWSDIPSSTLTLSSATTFLLAPLTNICYGHIRYVYTSTAAGAQTVTTVADVSGSLNSKYFLLDDAGSAHKYYVWFNINSAGVDPAIAGRTGVQITGATNVTANTLATSLRSSIGALNGSASFTTGGTNAQVTITNQSVGKFTPAVDGAAPTGFSFATTAGFGTIYCTVKTDGPY